MKKLFLLLFVTGMLGACTKESDETLLAGNGSSAVQRVAGRPFKGTFYTTVDPATVNSLTYCSGDVPNFGVPGVLFHGSATHLGDIIPELSTIQDANCNLSVQTMLLTTHGSGQIAANNGDLLYVSWDDAIDASAVLTQTGTTGTISGTWTITGGTGRFAGASGSFTISGPVDFATTSFQCEAVGTIIY